MAMMQYSLISLVIVILISLIEVVKDGKTYYKLSVPIDKGKIYLSRAVSGSYYNGFDTTIDNTKNLFKVNGNFNGGSWETY